MNELQDWKVSLTNQLERDESIKNNDESFCPSQRVFGSKVCSLMRGETSQRNCEKCSPKAFFLKQQLMVVESEPKQGINKWMVDEKAQKKA